MSATTTLSPMEIKNIMDGRRMGLYKTEDTLNEATLVSKQMEETDVCFTLHHNKGCFGLLNRRELKVQTLLWKELKCLCRKDNIFPVEIDGKTYYMFIIQPTKEKDMSMSPLAIAFNIMVDGYAYITPFKDVALDVVKALKK